LYSYSFQYHCNAGGWKNIPSDKQVCEFTPNTLIDCEIRARRESNSNNNNRNSEVATGSVTTSCPAGKHLLDIQKSILKTAYLVMNILPYLVETNLKRLFIQVMKVHFYFEGILFV